MTLGTYSNEAHRVCASHWSVRKWSAISWRLNGAQRRASEEAHLDEVREVMEAEEPALAREAIEG